MLLQVFGVGAAFVAPAGLTAKVLSRFNKPSQELIDGVTEQYTEHEIFHTQGLLLSSGAISKEWSPDGSKDGWAMTKTKARAIGFERLDGVRNSYLHQDARHLPYAGA